MAEEISQKSSENAPIKDETVDETATKEEVVEEKPSKKKKHKLKVSKGAKVEKLYDTKKGEGGDNNV